MRIAELEQTTALRILTHLLKAKKASRTELRRNIEASVSAIYNALPKLKRLRLIYEESKETFPFTVEVSLTQKGRRVAEHLDKIETILTE